MRSLDTYDASSGLAAAVREFCLAESVPGGFRPGPARPAESVAAWRALRERGTELWLDTGDLAAARALWCAEFSALTTNNTLLNAEVQKGIYDKLVPQAAAVIRNASRAADGDGALVLELAFVLNAVHGLKLVAEFGAKVSVELHTDLAHDVEASVAYGRRYHAICPSHFIVKVPLTPHGLIAARRLSDAGIPVNFTLGFSARQNLLIARAAKPAYCNVFMGRINALIADRGFGDGNNAGERATAASQRVVAELRAALSCPTKQIGASMRGPAQVPALAGLDVYTMPVAVARGWLDSGQPIGGAGAGDDFPVAFAPGVDGERDGLTVFWNVCSTAQEAVDALCREDVAALDGDALARVLRDAGGTSYFPEFTSAELAKIAADGKIPSADWRDAARSGRIAWDTMLTAAGLASFAADQAKLDERIRAHM